MPEITFATFNIGAASKKAGKFTAENLDLVVSAVNKSGADVVCMQEVDKNCGRSDKTDMPAYISEHTHCPYYHFIKIRDFQGGEYGTLIISRYPIVRTDTHNYPVKLAKWGTSAGMAEISVSGSTLRVFNTHLSCESDEKNSETLDCFADYLVANGKNSFVAAADFNTFPDKIASHISSASPVNTVFPTYTYKNIDNILVTSDIACSGLCLSDTVSDGTSDHRMLVCKLSF